MIRVPHSKSGHLLNYTRFAYHFARTLPNMLGTEKKTCPLCDTESRFLGFGYPPRYDVVCPRCGGFDRHRQIKLWLDANEKRFVDKDVLHFAPEEAIGRDLKRLGSSYKGADLMPGKADICLNIEKIDLADASIGVVVAIMVLEHVNDEAALSEVYRVLEPGGFALFMVPIVEAWAQTLEERDLSQPVQTRKDRFRYFGQWDHVRYYGRDFRDRLRQAGFDVEEFIAEEPDVRKYGLVRGETLFIATKPDITRRAPQD